ncbi:hypothetical protein ES708_18653 [subsurface metagenome]
MEIEIVNKLMESKHFLFTANLMAFSAFCKYFNISTLVLYIASNFNNLHSRIIYEYNLAQKDSRQLFNQNISKERIIEIKDKTGGYAILLLKAMIFPENDFEENDFVYTENPKTKNEALYSFGAWLSRIDDLWDIEKDNLIGLKQLATERVVTWDSIISETEKMKNGLKEYYPSSKVNQVIQKYFAPLIDKEIYRKYGVNKI